MAREAQLLMRCPICDGDLIADMLELAASVCMSCGRRFEADLTPAWRAPSAQEVAERGMYSRMETALLRVRT
jgi:transcription initiation factor TFIIIB Brf1 subunit/transcription initiation factor TFIIB